MYYRAKENKVTLENREKEVAKHTDRRTELG